MPRQGAALTTRNINSQPVYIRVLSKHAIVTPTALGLWGVTFLGYAHHGLLQPIIPLYLKNLGGSELLIGFALAAFSATSFTLRPAVGYLTDEWSVVGVLALGVLILGIGGLALLAPLIWLIFISNGIRGIGWAALNTAGTTLLAHLAPPTRRAEAAGYLSMFQSAGLAISSPLALWLVGLSLSNFNLVFVLAGAAGLVAAGVARWLGRASRAMSRPHPAQVTRRLRTALGTLDRDVLLPMFLQTCLILSFPALTAFVALYARELGLSQASVVWYFLANGLAAILTRLAVGRILDRLLRAVSAAMGFGVLTLAIVLMLNAASEAALVTAGVCFAVGYSITIASLTAMAIDMANPRRMGAAMATYSMANQLGAGVGAALSGAVIEAAGYHALYVAALVPGAVALAAIWFKRQQILGSA